MVVQRHSAKMSSNVYQSRGVSASELRHQLRTPLNHIIGYGEILLEEFPESMHRPSIESIVREARGMVETIQRVMGGDHPPDPEEAIIQLRDQLAARIRIVHDLVATLDVAMPREATEDLRRIAAAASCLDRALVEGVMAKPESGMLPAPHPMDTRVAVRPGSITGAGRILVVDDDALNRDMLSRQLERQGHHVDTAADGAAALAMLSATRFDMVLLDLMMPGMNGFEVLERIKRDPALSGVAVILVSALDEMDSVVRSIEAGAEDYLFKPVNPTLLRARIKSTLDKLRAEENVRRKQRLESIGLLAAGIAHDFNNLLTGIIGHAQLLEYSLTEPSDKEAIAAIVTAGERAADLTRQLLAYSGKTMLLMKAVDLVATLRDTEGLIHASLPRKVRLHLSRVPTPGIVGDENQIRQVLLNLVLNATEAIGPDAAGSITIETGGEKIAAGARFDVAPEEVKPGSYAWFEVRDSGCGMDAATAAKMFEPFFTTKFLGRGLGLAAVAGIVTAHHGLLRVTTSPGHGTAVRVCFPATDEIVQTPDAAEERLVLVVDDEPVIRQIVKVALERAGRKVLMASSGAEAIELFRKFSR
ncbi:MAG: response regulator, partial [Terriglobia bacterium]